MRVLAIDSATEACSVALFEHGALVDGHFAVIGRGHAERLVPMIAQLPGKGRADAIHVSLGPGSFTGVRIGLAAARALGLAWGALVLGYPTLALVAAMARKGRAEAVSVCMAGGHGEWFVQHFDAAGMASGPVQSLRPAMAAAGGVAALVAGNRAQELLDLAPPGTRARALAILPDARESWRLGADALIRDLAPIYGRPPDARLPGSSA